MVFSLKSISDIIRKLFVDLKTSDVRHRNMWKHPHTFNILFSYRIKRTKELDNRYLQNVASKVEKSNVDRVGVITRDGEMNSSSRILIDEA